jgi:hypothetical protein
MTSGMTSVLLADCAGLWRRTLLIEADGSRDTGGDVRWLQGITAYLDSRGFAGRLDQSGDVFEWNRTVDLEPPREFPDAGRMHWEDGTLIEIGVHADYAEHWVRDDGPASSCGALMLTSGEADEALLLRVGDLFGWAARAGDVARVLLAQVGGPEWAALSPRLRGDELYVDDVDDDDKPIVRRWRVAESEGDVDL